VDDRIGGTAATETYKSDPRDTVRFGEVARRRVAELAPDADVDAMDVVFSAIRLANRMASDVEAMVHRPRGLTWAGFRLLFTLWISGPLEPRELARYSAVTRASISSVLNTLQRDGLVERRRESPDGRVVTVVLTPAGRRVVADAFHEHNARESAWLAPLTRAERVTLGELLHRVLAEGPPIDGSEANS
jgi:DNA-binding MarR family transcriptional regulator